MDPNIILNWTKQVRNLFDLNKPDNHTALCILKILISDDLQYILNDQEDPDSALDLLVKEAFPKSNFVIYERKLCKIKSTNYSSITEFYKEFSKLISMANSCLDKKEQLNQREITNYFERALTKQERIYLINEDEKDIKKKVEHLAKLEKIETKINEENLIIKQTSHTTNRSNIYDKTWCKFHKSRFHNTKDCPSLKEKRHNTRTNEKDF